MKMKLEGGKENGTRTIHLKLDNLNDEFVRIYDLNADLVQALKNLTNKLDLIHDDPCYNAVWTNYHIHGGKYTGPTYTEELIKAKQTLAKCKEE